MTDLPGNLFANPVWGMLFFRSKRAKWVPTMVCEPATA